MTALEPAKNPNGKYNTGRPSGRPSRLNPRTATSLVNSISGGAYVTTACQFSGIAKASYGLWRRRGEAEIERVRALELDPEEILQNTMVDEEGKSYSVAQMMSLPAPEPFEQLEWNYVCFYMHTEKALAVSEIRNLSLIQAAAGDGHWQAAAWILERKYPDRFGRRERINLEGSKDGEPVTIRTVGVEDVEAAIKRLAGGG